MYTIHLFIHLRSMTNIVNMLRATLKVNTRAEYSTYIGTSQLNTLTVYDLRNSVNVCLFTL